jgi:hypothetical protein
MLYFHANSAIGAGERHFYRTTSYKYGLVSYFYLRNVKSYIVKLMKLPATSIYKRLLVDSGGYQTKSLGSIIDIDEYSDYCMYLDELHKNSNIGMRYVQIDVVGDPKKTLLNYEYMLKKGLKPLPV